MANTIIPKRSSVAGKVPLTTDLQVGEIAINLVDGLIFTKNAGGTIISLGGGGGLPIQSGNAGKFLSTDGTTASWAALTSSDVTTALGYTPYDATNPSGYITSSALTPYLTSATAASTYQTALGYTPANKAGDTFTGKVVLPAATTSIASLNAPHGTAPTTPVNGDIWTTTAALFARINGATQQLATLATAQTWTANQTFSNPIYANSDVYLDSSSAGLIRIGNNLGAGNILIGSSTQWGGITLGQSTDTHTLNIDSGATASGKTKTINFGGNGVSGSTTTINIGSSVSGATTNVNTYGTWTHTGTLSLGSTQLALASGGTGANSAAGARTNLGLVIGTNVQAWDADLDAIAALAGTSGILKKTAANTWTLDTSTYLTGNETVTISGDASGSGATSISLTLANSGVTAGTYTKVTVDAKGRVTTGASLASADLPTYTGTLTSGQVTTALGFTPLSLAGGTMTGSISFAAGQTWPTFNQNTTGSAATLTTGRTIGMTGDVTWTSGSFNGSANVTGTATLANSGVTAGTYTKVTVDAKGRVTTGASLASADLPTYTGTLTSSQVTTALGYTPYNSTNPNGYTSNTGTVTSVGLSLPAIFSVTGSPVTTSGTLSASLASQTANTFFAAPSGSAGAPSFRTLVAADIPALTLENLPDAWVKRAVRCATTANITLSGTQTIDGIAVVAGDRVLVKDQTTASQNGIYVVAAGAWTRSLDADSASELAGAHVSVDLGTANGGLVFDTDFRSTDTVGTTAVTWSRVIDSGYLTTVGNNLARLANPSAVTFLRVNADNTVSALDAATFRSAIGAGTSSTTGTVTSVGGTGTVSGLTLTGTVTSSGNLTLGGTLSVTPSNFASQTANTVLAAPNGSAGTPTFRALVAADIPALTLENVPDAWVKRSVRVATTADLGASTWSTTSSGILTGYAATASLAVTTTASSTTATTTSTAGIKVGAVISGNANIPASTTVASITNATTFVMSAAATAAGTSVTTTFTNTIAALSIDGIAVAANDRVLVKDQSTLGGIADASGAAKHGIYVVTNAGSTSAAWVLTRANDANIASELAAANVGVDSGTSNGGFTFDSDLKSTDTLNTTAINWSRVVDTGLASSTSPAMNGTAAVGTSISYARADHVHPTDTGRAPAAGSTSITTLGTIGTGTWQGSVINSTYGGTGVNNGGRTLAINTNSGTLTFTNASTTLTVANTASVSGTNTGDQTITLTGDVTGSGTGSFATTLANSGVTAGTYTLATITVDAKGRITSASSGSAGGGTTTNAVTFNNGGAGAASGTTFNGSAAVTVSYNTVGAPSTTGTNASGTWGISITGSAGSASTATTASTANALNTANNYQVNSLGVGTAGSGTAGEIRATNNITAYFSSDIKFKENVQDIPNAAAIAADIGGKYFDWTDAYIAEHGGEDGYFVQKQDFGVVAQDVLRSFPRAVRTRPDGSLAVDYEKLSALALAAVKEQEARIRRLEKIVEALVGD